MNHAMQENVSVDALVGQVADEFIELLERGEHPQIEEYVRRHPQLGPVIRDVLSALELMRCSSPGQAAPSDASIPSERPIGVLGDFRILREIGRGGMGFVYEAEQISLGRRVALKVLPFASTLDPKQLQRFKNEAQAAAGLHHTNIVPVYATGCERGVHYYAMQFIEGHTLAAVIREFRQQGGLETADLPKAAGPARASASEFASGRWALAMPKSAADQPTGLYAPAAEQRPSGSGDPTNAATLPVAALSTERSTTSPAYFRTVANLGVQAAEALEHAHQLGVVHRDIKPANMLVDGRGHLWITDFGLAHCQSQAGLTMTGDLIGTLRYMSPEQALAKRVLVDHRTDIYSLGATLYELLTLEPVFAGQDRQELLRQIAFEEPRSLRRQNGAVPAELETIVFKAIEKNPGDRYTTAKDLADDLGRFLRDEPIRARRPTLGQRARKWSLRHRPLVLLSSTFLGILVALLMAGVVVNYLLLKSEIANTDAANRELTSSLYFQTIARALREREAGNVGLAEELLDDARFQDMRGWEWHYLKRLRYGSPPPIHHTSCIWDLALSPDGRLLAAGGSDGSVKLWDTQTWKEVRTLQVHGRIIRRVAFQPGGGRLAAATWNGTVQIWDLATGAGLHTLEHGDDEVGSLVFSPEGHWILAGGVGSVKIWDVATGQLAQTLTLPGHTDVIHSMAFSPDGKSLALGNGDRTIKVFDTAGWTQRLTLGPHAGIVIGLAFSPDGVQLATACAQLFWNGGEGEVKIWDLGTGQPVYSLRGHTGGAFAVAFTPDGQRLASSGVDDAAVKLWDLQTARETLTLRGHWDGVRSVVFSPDGRRLYSAGQDFTVRVWDATPLGQGAQPELRTLPGHTAPVTSLAFSPDNRRLVSGSMDRTLKVWDTLTGQEISTLIGHTGAVRGLAFSPDGLVLASVSQCPEEPADATGQLKLWDTKTWREISSPGKGADYVPIGLILGVAFRSDGRRLAAAADDRVVVWDTATRTLIRTLVTERFTWRTGVAFGPEGQLASSAVDGTVQIWDQSVREEVSAFAALVAPSPGVGRLLQVWRASTCLPTCVLPAHEGRAMAVAFNPDGSCLASAGLDGTIRFWDVRTFKPIATLGGGLGGVHSLAFRPDGKRLASAGNNATIQVWDTASRRSILTFRGHTDAIYTVAFSPDGRSIASGGWDKTVKIWDAEPLPEGRRRAAAGPDE